MIEDEIRAAENRRCKAMVDGDIPALSALFADEMTYVHTTGRVDNKASYLAETEANLRYHAMKRLTYVIRDHGDVALANGELFLDLTILSAGKRQSAHLVTSQVWLRSADGWQQAGYHASVLGA